MSFQPGDLAKFAKDAIKVFVQDEPPMERVGDVAFKVEKHADGMPRAHIYTPRKPIKLFSLQLPFVDGVRNVGWDFADKHDVVPVLNVRQRLEIMGFKNADELSAKIIRNALAQYKGP